MRMFIAVFAVLLPAPALAATCDNPEALLRQAFPSATDSSDGMLIAGDYAQRVKPEDIVCKVWPFKPELTLLAVPLLEAEPANEGETHGDVEVIVADSKTGEPLARRREKGMAYGDAIQFRDLELDTARYDIKPGIRAFGVVTNQFGSSMANPYLESSLWLYTFSDDRLDRVLDGLVTVKSNAENDGNCAGTGTEIRRTVAIASPEHRGHRDLLVDETETATVTRLGDEDCVSTETSHKPRQLTLQFDGERYRPVPATDEDGLFSYIEIAKDP